MKIYFGFIEKFQLQKDGFISHKNDNYLKHESGWKRLKIKYMTKKIYCTRRREEEGKRCTHLNFN